MHPIIALWSHPRSMSTAIERIMRERGDCACFHEPFLYEYYVHRRVRVLPHFDVDPAQPVSYKEIRDTLLAVAERAPVFFKDMSYYVVPRLFEDEAFATRVTHSFLIRDPVKSILSYYKLDPEVTSEEVGLEAEWQHYDWLERTFCLTPVVLEAEAVQQGPQSMMATFWERIGLPFKAEAFSWRQEETPEDWGQVAGWHGTAGSSEGIAAPSAEEDAARQAAFDRTAEANPRLRDLLDQHQPFYERLRTRAISPL